MGLDARTAGMAPDFAVARLLKRESRMNAPTVLVVDDEPLARWSVSETLRDSGYRVTQAGDALSALTALDGSGGTADLVLLDLRLPDSSDLGVLSMMRRLSPKTPIILMTAYGSEKLRAEARTRGACAVIDKPFDMSVLAPLVATAINSREASVY
jgi:DNA-binding NtrC family response regulator